MGISYKKLVQDSGEFVLDYVESRSAGQPRWFVGRGRVAGNTAPLPSGLHATPRLAWYAAAQKLGLTRRK